MILFHTKNTLNISFLTLPKPVTPKNSKLGQTKFIYDKKTYVQLQILPQPWKLLTFSKSALCGAPARPGGATVGSPGGAPGDAPDGAPCGAPGGPLAVPLPLIATRPCSSISCQRHLPSL